MRIWGQIQKVCLELLGADPAQGVQGRFWFNTVSKQMKLDDGLNIHTIQYGDQNVGTAPEWILNGNAPVEAIDTVQNKVFLFAVGLTQAMYAVVKIPNGYVTGRPVILNLNCYSPGVANAFLIQTLSTLVRTGTDINTSVVNQRTSTNAAFVMTAPTAGVPQRIQLDLTDATGHVNGVAVSANDLIFVKLSRAVTVLPVDDLNDVSVYDAAEVVF